MTTQKYKDFLEHQEYTEEKIKELDQSHKSFDFRNVAILILCLLLLTILGSHLFAKKQFQTALSIKDEQIKELQGIAYDGNGRAWESRYKEIDKQYHRALDHMNALGYDMSFQYPGQN